MNILLSAGLAAMLLKQRFELPFWIFAMLMLQGRVRATKTTPRLVDYPNSPSSPFLAHGGVLPDFDVKILGEEGDSRFLGRRKFARDGCRVNEFRRFRGSYVIEIVRALRLLLGGGVLWGQDGGDSDVVG